MNDVVKRFLDEMGAGYAEDGDRDISPILFKADDVNGGTLFELSLPKGEPHPYWRVREREMTPDEVVSLMQEKSNNALLFRSGLWGTGPVQTWGVGSTVPDTHYRVRGWVFNARVRNEWNLSVDGAKNSGGD